MTEVRARPTDRPVAIAALFVANGFGGPSFLARLPDRQQALGLSDAALGATLVGLALGALLVSPLAGRAVGRFGSRRVTVTAGVTLGALLWLVGVAPTALTFFLAMLVVGMADAAMDIAMNAHGAAHEARTGRSILHRLHGAWSIGALSAAGVAGLAAALGVSLAVQLAAVGGLIAVASLAARPHLVRGGAPATATPPAATAVADVGAPAAGGPGGDGEEPGRGGRRRRRLVPVPLMALAAATVGGAMIEGASADWAAVQLERFGTSEGVAATGVGAFMGGMVAGRLVGDRLNDRWGPARLLRRGMALAAIGLAAGALVPVPIVFGLGLVASGLGAAGLFPLAFSAAERTPSVPPGVGAATVSLAARFGFMADPLTMGTIAEAVGLRWAYAVVAAVAVAMSVSARRILGRPGASP